VTNATTFRLATETKWCEKLFGCPDVQGNDPELQRLEFGTPERCADVLVHQPSADPIDRDLDEKLQAGTIELRSDQVPACLDALSDCNTYLYSTRKTPACQAVFRGKSSFGEACSREEDCVEGAHCTLSTTCPGTCVAVQPPLPLDTGCSEKAECDLSLGDVECVPPVWEDGRFCKLVTRFPPADLGAPCWWGYGTELRLCKDGLYCRPPDEEPEFWAVVDPGTCEERLPLDATCDEDVGPPCAVGASCIDQVCRTETVVQEAGAACDHATYCNPSKRLFCNAGVCELTSDGSEGSRCLAVGHLGALGCEPGLVCLSPEPDAPVDPTVGRAWSKCGKPHDAGEACAWDDECASRHCLTEGTCGDTYCCDTSSCEYAPPPSQ